MNYQFGPFSILQLGSIMSCLSLRKAPHSICRLRSLRSQKYSWAPWPFPSTENWMDFNMFSYTVWKEENLKGEDSPAKKVRRITTETWNHLRSSSSGFGHTWSVNIPNLQQQRRKCHQSGKGTEGTDCRTSLPFLWQPGFVHQRVVIHNAHPKALAAVVGGSLVRERWRTVWRKSW